MADEDVFASDDLDLVGQDDYDMLRQIFQDSTRRAFKETTKKLRKVVRKKRKCRHSEVDEAITFFEEVVKCSESLEVLENFLDEVLENIICISELLCQLIDEDDDVFQLSKTFSSYVCLFLEHLKEKLNPYNLLKDTIKLHKFYLDLAINNPTSWSFVMVAGGPMELLGLAIDETENKEEFIDCFQSHMLLLHNSIISCGDFECQRSLMVHLITWLQIVPQDIKDMFIRECFRLVSYQFRGTVLFKAAHQYDADVKSRYFLNALNKKLANKYKSFAVYSILCTNVFLEGDTIKNAEHFYIREFWIDFSCRSKRIHFYCSIPTSKNRWNNISIQKEQIESACLFYPMEPHQAMDELNLTMSQETRISTTQKDSNLICYVHILLKEGFNTFCNGDFGINKRSLVFELKYSEEIEEMFTFFQFDIHECDQETYRRLVPDLPKTKIHDNQYLESLFASTESVPSNLSPTQSTLYPKREPGPDQKFLCELIDFDDDCSATYSVNSIPTLPSTLTRNQSNCQPCSEDLFPDADSHNLIIEEDNNSELSDVNYAELDIELEKSTTSRPISTVKGQLSQNSEPLFPEAADEMLNLSLSFCPGLDSLNSSQKIDDQAKTNYEECNYEWSILRKSPVAKLDSRSNDRNDSISGYRTPSSPRCLELKGSTYSPDLFGSTNPDVNCDISPIPKEGDTIEILTNSDPVVEKIENYLVDKDKDHHTLQEKNQESPDFWDLIITQHTQTSNNENCFKLNEEYLPLSSDEGKAVKIDSPNSSKSKKSFLKGKLGLQNDQSDKGSLMHHRILRSKKATRSRQEQQDLEKQVELPINLKTSSNKNMNSKRKLKERRIVQSGVAPQRKKRKNFEEGYSGIKAATTCLPKTLKLPCDDTNSTTSPKIPCWRRVQKLATPPLPEDPYDLSYYCSASNK